MSRDLGDFQTPPLLVEAVLSCLTRQGRQWTRALEPTCGRGNFIAGMLNLEPHLREIQGIEFQIGHVEIARLLEENATTHVTIHRANIFDLRLRDDLAWQDDGPMLVIGNPPWVTNSEMGILGSANLPRKTNLKKLPGFQAMTGNSNFDITEYIWLKLIKELTEEQPTIALLCKSIVARNVLQFAADHRLPITNPSIRHISAKKWFGAAVDACLFCVEVNKHEQRYEAQVYEDLDGVSPTSRISVVSGRLVSSVEANPLLDRLDGKSQIEWRSGVKHDAASIVELTVDQSGTLRNKQGEAVDVEPNYVFPLLKSSDLGGQGKLRGRRFIIVPQKRLGEDTSKLAFNAPDLWAYFALHQDVFKRRRSSIYLHQPTFAYLGIGDYSFARYKVAISGMYKTLSFCAVGPIAGQPVMLDDTCYFVPCNSAQQAALIASLLNDAVCLSFIHSIAFWDTKRPITKKLLQRIDLVALLQHVQRDQVIARAEVILSTIESTGSDRPIVWPHRLEQIILEGWLGGETQNIVQLTLLTV